VAYEFPWLAIRKNEAYPVFTNASTNDRYPGHKSKRADQEGQINALFRWKTRQDTPRRLVVDLWLVRPDNLAKPVSLADSSITDVTFRRLQRFKVDRAGEYRWELRRCNQPVASGKIHPDAAGLLTAPRVTITRETASLEITAP
jgi:hypothetical protein